MKFVSNIQKILVLIALISSLIACHRSINLTDSYYYSLGTYLTLSDDSTYYYQFGAGYRHINSSGFWKINNRNKLILNSNLDPHNLPITVRENKNLNSKDSLFIKVNSIFAEKDTLPLFVLIINDSIKIKSSDGRFILQKYSLINRLKMLYIVEDHLEDGYIRTPFRLRDTIGTMDYIVKDNTSNVYDISWKFDWDIFFYEVFIDEIFDIRKRYLSSNSHNYKLFKK